ADGRRRETHHPWATGSEAAGPAGRSQSLKSPTPITPPLVHPPQSRLSNHGRSVKTMRLGRPASSRFDSRFFLGGLVDAGCKHPFYCLQACFIPQPQAVLMTPSCTRGAIG
ncbi:MAG: hypothetical protein ACK55I_46075, partial [bacterium]